MGSAIYAYLAGIIDADGYITINRSQRGTTIYHAPQVGIAGTRRQPHDLAASLWGGNVGLFKPNNPSHREQYQWTRQGAAAVAVIEAIRPYLLIKADHADLAIELWEHVQAGRFGKDDPFPWMGPDYDPVRARDLLRTEMIDMNQSRNRVRRTLAA